jgi:hypothetical protein
LKVHKRKKTFFVNLRPTSIIFEFGILRSNWGIKISVKFWKKNVSWTPSLALHDCHVIFGWPFSWFSLWLQIVHCKPLTTQKCRFDFSFDFSDFNNEAQLGMSQDFNSASVSSNLPLNSQVFFYCCRSFNQFLNLQTKDIDI